MSIRVCWLKSYCWIGPTCSNDFSRSFVFAMPYEYSKLSLVEREEIVRHRSEQGYPLHAPPHPFRDAGAYLITAANFEHKAVMNSPKRRTEFETRLLNSIKEFSDELIAWMVLPNHYHILIMVKSLDDVSTALKQLHGTTSREWNIEDNLTGSRRVWYKFADTRIRNDVHLHAAFNYIHFNPVKHGYAGSAYDWHWSSLSLYYNDKGRDWLRTHWKEYTPPNDFGNGWDDFEDND
ncbi:MAG: transposase [Chloroflexi bacterium]|nr:transposase [Chloroflexota bacterium]